VETREDLVKGSAGYYFSRPIDAAQLRTLLQNGPSGDAAVPLEAGGNPHRG